MLAVLFRRLAYRLSGHNTIVCWISCCTEDKELGCPLTDDNNIMYNGMSRLEERNVGFVVMIHANGISLVVLPCSI